MTQLLFRNARIFDGVGADCPDGMSVLVEDDRIREVSERPIAAPNARVIDVRGRTLMPGMIDAHVHATIGDVNIQRNETLGDAYRAAHAVRMLGHALDCGFTTVRDVGGGDYSLSRAIADRVIRAPRFFYAGKILSMTGGHGDFRPVDERPRYHSMCSCGVFNSSCKIADGVDECIRAAREELRQGAHCIKLMGSGGVLSPTDPIWMNQYRPDEISAIVTECTERRSYAAAHCHPASAIRRCVECGVRSIEHGTLIDAETAGFVAERGAYIVPTMAIIFALREASVAMGVAPQSREKLEQAYAQALSGMDLMRRAGVKVGFGTDLGGSTYTRQCTEFAIRREVFTPLEILRQVTSISAELMMMQGLLGCVAAGAYADLLVVDGDPLQDLALLAADGRKLPVIVRGGEVVKDELR